VADPSTLDIPALIAEAERLGYVRERDPDDGLPWWVDSRPRAMLCPDGNWLVDGRRVGPDEAAALRWLLATPEARRLADIVEAAEARGREAERADVLAAVDAEREAPEPDLWRLAWRIQHGEHVGAVDRARR
jgi:hypothetical protein